MMNPFFKIPLYVFAFTAIVLIFLCAGASAQAQEPPDEQEIKSLKKAIEELTKSAASMKEMISEDAVEDLKFEVGRLKELLDLETMEDEVSELFDMNKKERRVVRDILADFRDHWIQGGSCQIHTEDDDIEWFESLLTEVEDRLDSRKADRFADWLTARKAAVDRVGEDLAEAAEQFGEAAGRWAEQYAEEIAEDAVEIGEWAGIYGERWGEWAEEFAEEIAEYSTEYAEEYAEMGEEIGRIVEESISDMDWEGFAEEIVSITEACIPTMEDEVFIFEDDAIHDHVREYTEKIHKAADALRDAVGRKREKLEAHQHYHHEALKKALKDLGFKVGKLDWLEDREIDREEDRKQDRKRAWEKATEHFEKARLIHERESDKAKAAIKEYELARKLKESDEEESGELLLDLLHQKEEIRARDEALRALKEEVKMLREEIQRMKKDEKARAREKAKLEDRRQSSLDNRLTAETTYYL